MKRFILILAMVSLLFIIACDSSGPSLNADVSFDGLQFTITNQSLDNWTNVKLTLNSAYSYSISNIRYNSEMVIEAADFTLWDGTKFNPFTTKPLSITIDSDQGSYSGHWE